MRDTDASVIIQNKLAAAGGRAMVRSFRGKVYEIFLSNDGKSFTCPTGLANTSHEFRVFDEIVGLLRREGGTARKGHARGKGERVGMDCCDEHTVMGVVAIDYYGKKYGESAFDPVFILASILEWADIAKNGRGDLTLTTHYRQLIDYRG